MIEIPPDRLDSELLESLIESFVLREGTDYGDREVLLEIKIEQIREQLTRGRVIIVFDPETESCNLLTREAFDRCRGAG